MPRNAGLFLLLLLPTAGFALPCSQIHPDVPRIVSSPGRLHTDDFDADGNADVLTGSSISYGRGDGTFEPPAVVFAEAALKTVVTDFDGDRRPDILTASYDTLALRVNLGNRTFAAPRIIRQAAEEILMATGDFTKDGSADILVGRYGSEMFAATLVNDGNGHFTDVQFRAPLYNPAVGDFDGDGNADLVSALVGLTILYGDGTGRFGARRNSMTPRGTPFSADVNGDGRDDIVSIQSEPNEIFVLYGPIPASKTTVSPRHVSTSGGMTLIPADYNGDGALDLSVLAGGRVRVYLNDHSGGLVTSGALLGPPAASQFATADFNRDGALDLAVGAGGGFAVSLGRGDGTFRFPRTNLLPGARLIGAADLDGDAADELLVLRDTRLFAGEEEVPVDIDAAAALTGDYPVAATGNKLIAADGTLVRTFARDAGAQWREVAAWDAGAHVKALTATAGEIAIVAGPSMLQIRRADGTLLASEELPPTSKAAVQKADVDGDGHVDLLVTGSGNWTYCGSACAHNYVALNDGYVLWFRGRGNGMFDAALPLVTKTQITDVTPGDFDGDRHSDFVLTTLSGDVSLYYGGIRRVPLHDASVDASHVAGDVNGDGIQDLALHANEAITLFYGAAGGLVEGGTYLGTDIPYIVRRGPARTAAVVYTLPFPFGEAGVIESDCRIGRRRIVRH